MKKENSDMIMTMMLLNKLGGKVTFSQEDGKNALDMMFKEGTAIDSDIDSEGNFTLEIIKREKAVEKILNSSKSTSSEQEDELLNELVDLINNHADSTDNKKESCDKEKYELSVIIAHLLRKLGKKKISITQEELDNIGKSVIGLSIKANNGIEVNMYD